MTLSEASTIMFDNIKDMTPSIDEMDSFKTPVSNHVNLATGLKKTPPQKKTYNKVKIKQTPVHYTDDDYFPSTRVNAVRVKPEMDDSLSNDTILLNILNILYNNESGNELENGLTVKQICDMLLVKDPDMISLSTKFANLISAKINAYAKKVENRVRGDFKVNIKYWIIRKWAKGNSPRRMVYIYKGLLPDDYTEAPPKSNEILTPVELTSTKGFDVADKPSVKADINQQLTSKNMHYNALMNGGGLNKINSINGKINAAMKPKPNVSKNNNKFSVNFNRFQQFGYKGANGGVQKQKPSNITESEEVQKSPLLDQSLNLDDDRMNTDMESLVNKDGHVTSISKNDKIVNRVDLTKQLQLIHKAIYQASPVQRIHKLNREKRRNSTNLMFNKKWMETLKSGFMYEEISTPDKLNLSDFDRLFD